MADVDVIIVGAGAAGLVRPSLCRGHGLTFKVLEAMDRIGGRAHTSSAAFRHAVRYRLCLAACGGPQSVLS